MIIDCISDLHGEKPKLEGGDVLIVAGDLTCSHTIKEFSKFFTWLEKQDYKHKIVIGGNHDSFLQQVVSYGEKSINLGKNEKGQYNYYYLCEASIVIDGIKFFGTPWTKTFPGISYLCKAFTVDSDKMLKHKWKAIPDDTNVLITHSPPFGILDTVERYNEKPESVGSISLRETIERIQPRLHIFGHIHNGYGQQVLKCPFRDIICVNASIMNEYYDPVNSPIRIIL